MYSVWGSMANEIGFLYPLSPELRDRLRVRATKEYGSISSFVVQYEALLEDQWHPIVRYDTSHGFSHKDTLHPDGREDKQPLAFPSYNIAFTFAIQDLKASWQWYRTGHEREIADDPG
jgi:hypothetical protein